jgi:hypothetical protein
MSSGVLNQIAIAEATNQNFSNELNGVQPSASQQIFEDPYVLLNEIVQNCTWSAVNPLVHYTVEDLSGEESEENVSLDYNLPISLSSEISNTVCSLGRRNVDYNSGKVENLSFSLLTGMFQLNFSGVNDLPYAIWASTNLLDWSQIGIASQLYPDPYFPPYASFQFDELATTNYPARFYQLRLP